MIAGYIMMTTGNNRVDYKLFLNNSQAQAQVNILGIFPD
jgi:hypothetical protein